LGFVTCGEHMGDTRYLKRRHETWFFSLAVPRELRAKTGKDRIVASLKTRDLAVAQERRWGKLVEAQEAFAKLAGKTPAATKTLAPDAQVQIDDFARTTYRRTLAQMADDDRKGIPWEKPELDRGWLEAFNGYVIDTDFKPVAEALAAYCAEHAIEPGTLHYQMVGDALLSARMHALKGRANALEGKLSDEPTTFLLNRPIDPITLRPLRSVGRGGLIFADVAARFIAEKQRDPAYKLTEQTKGQYEAAFRLFDQWAHQPKLDDVDRRKASDFLDAIASLDPHWGRGPGVKKLSFAEITKRFGGGDRRLSAKTINRYAMALSMVWGYAEDRDGYAGANPWTRQSRPTAKRRGSSELDKRAFTAAEIAKLLELQPSTTPANEVPAMLPWLTLIGAYSGMRLNEICELTVDDVIRAGSGISI
jgi:hypothetical protein